MFNSFKVGIFFRRMCGGRFLAIHLPKIYLICGVPERLAVWGRMPNIKGKDV